MTNPTYPFDDRFKLLVEEHSDWWYLINGNEPGDLEEFGYSKEQISVYIKALTGMTLDELIYLALQDDSDDSPALYVLQQCTSRDVFDRAIQLSASDNPKERVLGIEILMRTPGLQFKAEAVSVVCKRVEVETSCDVMEVLAYALCHLDVERRSDLLKRIADAPSAATRKAVAYSLYGLDDDVAVELLIGLSADEDGEVRNWATFGLQPENKALADKQEIRDALFARVHDEHIEARHEALVGLAQYKDARVVAPLIEALNAESVWQLAVEAAEKCGAPELEPHLIKLRDWWDVDPQLLERAIAACAVSELE